MLQGVLRCVSDVFRALYELFVREFSAARALDLEIQLVLLVAAHVRVAHDVRVYYEYVVYARIQH